MSSPTAPGNDATPGTCQATLVRLGVQRLRAEAITTPVRRIADGGTQPDLSRLKRSLVVRALRAATLGQSPFAMQSLVRRLRLFDDGFCEVVGGEMPSPLS